MPEAERAAKVQQISSQLKQVKEIVASRKTGALTIACMHHLVSLKSNHTEIREQIKALQAELDALWEVPELRKHRVRRAWTSVCVFGLTRLASLTSAALRTTRALTVRRRTTHMSSSRTTDGGRCARPRPPRWVA